MTCGSLIREGRKRAGLSQRELARRLDTSQAAIARWESRSVKPTFESVERALRACGLELRISLVPVDDHDTQLDREQRQLSPGQRLRRLENHVALILEGRRQLARS
jgi:transcriptional regulator with XRE-family HTH domain